MDFHNMKRRELQALCKKHKIPANLTNLEMADRLTAHFAVKEKPLPRERPSCLKGLDENVSENDSDVGNRPAKKVRFSPQNEMIEFQISEARYIEVQGRGRRKSVLCKDKDNVLVVTTNNDRVTGEVGEPRKSRRVNSLVENAIKSKGDKRSAKVDALRDNNDITGDATNGEVRKVRRSRRGKVLEETVENKGEKTSNTKGLEDNNAVENAVNGEIREVRRSRRGKLSERSEFESKEGIMAAKVVAFKDKNLNTSNSVNGEVREIRRCRRGKKLGGTELESRVESACKISRSEDNGTAGDVVKEEVREVGNRRCRRGNKLSAGREIESIGGKGFSKAEAMKDSNSVNDVLDGNVREVRRSRRNKFQEHSDVLKGKVSVAGDVSSVNVQNKELEVNKRLLSARGLLDQESGEHEGVEKIIRNLRSEKDDDLEDVVGNKEEATESASVQLQVGVRRSSRHVTKVDYVQIVSNKLTKQRNVMRGRLRSNIALGVKKISEAAEIAVVDKYSRGEDNLRRSPIEASKLECATSKQGTDVAAAVKNKKGKQKRRGDVVLEGSAALIDVVTSAEIVNITQKEKGQSEKINVEVKDSFIVDTTLTDPDAQAASTETPTDSVPENCINAELSSNAPEFEKARPAESNLSMDGQVSSSIVVNDSCIETRETILRNPLESKQDKFTSGMHSVKSVKTREEVSPIQPSCSGPLYSSSAVTNFYNTQLSSSEDPKPDENDISNIAQENSGESWNFKLPDGFERSASKTLLDGYSDSDMPAAILLPSTNVVERTIEFSGSIHDSTIGVSPKSLCTLPLNGAMGLETYFERSKQLPTEKSRDVVPDFDKVAGEALKTMDLETLVGISAKSLSEQSGSVVAKCDNVVGESLKAKMVTPSEMCTQSPAEPNRDIDPEYKNVAEEALKAVELKQHLEMNTPSPTQLSSCHESQFDMAGEALKAVELETRAGMSTESPTEQRGYVEPECDKWLGEAFKANLDTFELCTESPSKQCVDSDCDLAREAIKVVDLETRLDMCIQLPADQSEKVGLEFEKVAVEALKAVELKAPIILSPSATKEYRGSEPEFDIALEELKSVDLETNLEASRQIPTEQRRDAEAKVDIAGEVLKTVNRSESSTWQSRAIGSDLDFEGQATVQSRDFKLESHEAAGETPEAEDLETRSEMHNHSPNQQSKGVEPEVFRDGHAADSPEHEDVGQDCSFEAQELNSAVRTISSKLDNIDPSNGDSKTPGCKHSLQYDKSRTDSSLKEERDLPGDGDGIAACDAERNSPVQGTLTVIGWEVTEFEQGLDKSCTRSNNPQKSSSLSNHLGYGVCSEVIVGEQSFFSKANETPGSEDAEIEEYIIQGVKNWNGLDDLLVDQSELVTKGTGKEIYGSEAEIHEPNYGQEEPMNPEKMDSSELESPNNLIYFTEDCEEDSDFANGSKLVPPADSNSQKEEAFMDIVDSKEYSDLKTQSSKRRNAIYGDSQAEGRIIEARHQEPELSASKFISMSASTSKSSSILKSSVTGMKSSNCHSTNDNVQNQGHEAFFEGVTEEEQGHKISVSDEDDENMATAQENSSTNSVKEPNETSKDNELAESGHEVLMHILENKTPPGESKGGDVFLFDDIKLAGEEKRTSLAMLFETPMKLTSTKDELMYSDIWEHIASEYSVTKHHFIFHESKIEGSEYREIPPMMSENPNSTFQGNLFTEVEGFVPWVQAEASDVEVSFAAGKDHSASDKEVDQGKATHFVKSDIKSVSRESPQQQTNAARADLEHNLVSGATKNSIGSGKSVAFGKTENISLEFKIPPGESKGDYGFPFDDFKLDGEEKGTSIDMLFETPIKLNCSRAELMNCTASEASVTKHPLVFHESEVANSGHGEILSMMFENPDSTSPSQGNLLIEDKGFVPSVESKSSNVVVPVAAGKDNNASDKEIGQGKATNLIKSYTKSVSGAVHQCPLSTDRVDLEHNLVSDAMANSIRIGKSVDVANISLDIEMPPGESKGGDMFLFDDMKLAREEKGTSLALLFETPIKLTSAIRERTSESSVTKHPLVFQGSDVAGSEYGKIPSMISNSPDSSLQGNLSTEIKGFVPLVQSEASKVDEPVVAGNGASDIKAGQGKATNMVKSDSKTFSRAAHQRPPNAGRADLEHNSVSNWRINSIRTGKSVAVAKKSENISTSAKSIMKTNARTILIHGTPKKLQLGADMKENAISSKLGKVGSMTTVRPGAKRPPLKHIPWK